MRLRSEAAGHPDVSASPLWRQIRSLWPDVEVLALCNGMDGLVREAARSARGRASITAVGSNRAADPATSQDNFHQASQALGGDHASVWGPGDSTQVYVIPSSSLCSGRQLFESDENSEASANWM